MDGLNKNTPFCKSGKIILSKKLKKVFTLIGIYLEDDCVENLHKLRISIRRFRYVLEIYKQCYSKKLYSHVYNYAKHLQDIVGEGRDLDVIGLKVESIANDYLIKIPKRFYKKIDNDKTEIRKIIKLELIKFIDDKKVNSFINNSGKK